MVQTAMPAPPIVLPAAAYLARSRTGAAVDDGEATSISRCGYNMLDDSGPEMGKKAKFSTPYRDGWKAAGSGQGRSANPYPFSSARDRADWFKGYDEYLRMAAA